ncbi:MAG: hypothetical protein KAW41_00565 [Candidatus Diapherotrites archaeon]|nr:hypothetical protein [Candidatus Diapherotrites archaeon]
MPVVESEFDRVISKDHIYVIEKAAQEAADRIAENHALPEKIVLKISARPQPAGTHIDYSDWKIVLDYNSMNLQKALIEKRALKGLLAHEIMHMAQKLDGTEKEVIRIFTKSFRERGLGRDRFEFMKALGMITKDIFVNDALIKEGFSGELFKHYLIVIHSRVKDNVLPFSELTQDRVDDFFIALAALFPAYVPFYRAQEGERGQIIKSSIEMHFADIPRELSACLDSMEAALLQASLTENGIEAFIESALACYSHLLSS